MQHHWHQEVEGQRVPHPYCRKKGVQLKKGKRKRHGCEEICKQDFPKTHQLNSTMRVLCPGIAKRHKLNVKGRRNVLCMLLAVRRCKWLSGTSPAFAAWFGSNSHLCPNFRIPLMEQTHDPTCEHGCLDRVSDRHLCKLAQRAMRQMTGYFSGYISKRQPVGRFELKAASKLHRAQAA